MADICPQGLILSFSILFAAGLAIYEHNPEIRNWVDDSRRKVAVALHDLGDELAPQPRSRRTRSQDASTREDSSAEATERRRKARAEILERARVLEERRRGKRASAKSFDELVDEDGVLKDKATAARATATKVQPGATEMRKRNVEVQEAALGATLANPFEDETPMGFYPKNQAIASVAHSRSSTPTPSSPTQPFLAPETPQTLIDPDSVANSPSKQLVDLTPTASLASLPTSAHREDLASLEPLTQANGDEAPAPEPWSMPVDHWLEPGNASFYSAPSSPPACLDDSLSIQHSKSGASTPTVSESGEHVSQIGSEDMDVLSEFGDISTPGSWTEVGSVSSEDY